MRKIKFRAWNNREKVMSPLRGFDFLIKQAIINCPNEKSKTAISSWDYKDKEIKLMQFTGLKDENGVDIYEGDIVQYTQSDYRELESYNNNAEIIFENGSYKIARYDSGDSFHLNINDDTIESVEVIGNIYENPELLEVSE